MEGNNPQVHVASVETAFYGDSDCDENPFAPPEEQPLQRQYSASEAPFDDEQNRRPAFLLESTAAAGPSANTSVTMIPRRAPGRPATVFPRGLHWQAFPSSVPSAFEAQSFPTVTGVVAASSGNNNQNKTTSSVGGLVAGSNYVFQDRLVVPGIETMGSEVETETEGETEGDETCSEEGGDDSRPRYSTAANATTAEERIRNNMNSVVNSITVREEDCISLVDAELRHAAAGRADPHAMRLLLRKAGYIPPSRRKDVWRLLILGRVEPGTRVGSNSSNKTNNCPGNTSALDAAILSTDLDLDNQRVVRVDVERTRPALEQFKRPRVKNLLTRVLTHHCKKNGLGYKQGMHEVLAPFVALSDPELPTSDIYLCYGAFIKRFLPYAFNKDEEFLSLQICFRLFRILLLYHHPRLCRFLDQYQLQPELYATPWFLTLFSNSLDLPRLFEVWDFYLFWGDPALHHFVVLAFVIGNANVILQAEEANLPETMCRLTVGMRSIEELRELMLTAKDLMLNTPKSFRKILRSALYANLSQVSSCIPVSAEEVISYILHKNPHRQLDQESDEEDSAADENSAGTCLGQQAHRGFVDGGRGQDKSSLSPQRIAERAAMRSLRGHRQYIIMDCRPRAEFEACRLAPALHLDPDLLISPDDLDAKLKEFMPLQGMAHFCLVGAGGEAASSGPRSRAAPSDLSGEAMGLRPTASSDRSKSEASGSATASGGGGVKNDRTGDGSSSVKSDGQSSREKDKDGGFSWMGNLSRALARAQGEGVGKEGEEAVGREEDVQVARFVLMLLQYNFPFISHVRGDMVACLQELSAQAVDEKDEQHISSGGGHDTLLDGILIGTDADRVREELTYCSPEKKPEGLFAGFPKWNKGQTEAGGAEGEGRGRSPSFSRRSKQMSDRGASAIAKKEDGKASRGRGGMGRRGSEDFIDQGAKGPDQPAGESERKSSKRRLFGGVLDRFDKADSKDSTRRGGGNGDSTVADTCGSDQSSPPKTDPAMAAEGQRWLAHGPASAEGSTLDPELHVWQAEEAGTADAPAALASSAQGEDVRRGGGTWVKPGKPSNPERFARFLGKVLGVRDDALQDDTSPGVGRSSAQSTGVNVGAPCESLEEPGRRHAASNGTLAGGETAGWVGARAVSTSSTRDSAHADGEALESVNRSESGTTGGSSGAVDAAPVTATAVYSVATVESIVTADALPMALAVALPVTCAEATASATERSDRRCDRPLTRSVRPQRTTAAAARLGLGGSATAGSTRREIETALVTGEPVSISEWVAKEQRESGGLVRVFSAQRVVDGKVQKRCRLAVSPKNMTQFDNVEEASWATGGAKGVISEHRGLRHLARITSRKKHADLIVFHFKSRSGSSSSTASSSRLGPPESTRNEASGGGSSTSRRTRSRSTSMERESAGQPDVLYYFMREHADCLKMVKENYRRVTGGGSGDGGGGGSNSSPRVTSSVTTSTTSRRVAGVRRSTPSAVDEPAPGKTVRSTARVAAGAAAGAAGIMVGAAAGVAVGAAAGVAVGAAFLAGHRKGSYSEDGHRRATSSSPSRLGRRGGDEGRVGTRASAELQRSGGWIPIGEAAAGSDPQEQSSGSGRRPSTGRPTRRASGSAGGGEFRRGARAAGGSGGKASSGKGRGGDGGPSWLGRG